MYRFNQNNSITKMMKSKSQTIQKIKFIKNLHFLSNQLTQKRKRLKIYLVKSLRTKIKMMKGWNTHFKIKFQRMKNPLMLFLTILKKQDRSAIKPFKTNMKNKNLSKILIVK